MSFNSYVRHYSKMCRAYRPYTGTTFLHVTFVPEPLVLKRSYLLTFFSLIRGFFTTSKCVTSNVARTFDGTNTCEFETKEDLSLEMYNHSINQSINKNQCKDVCSTLYIVHVYCTNLVVGLLYLMEYLLG